MLADLYFIQTAAGKIMLPIFEYLDYRAFLKDFFEDQRQSKPFFSFRYAASRCGVDASNLAKVLQGGRHLSKKAQEGVCRLCGLEGKAADFFRVMLDFGRARSDAEAKKHFEKLLALQGPRVRQVAGDQYEFYSRWQHIAVFTLLDTFTFDGNNWQDLVQRLNPPVSVSEAKESIRLLERLGLIRKNDKGNYMLTDTLLTSGEKWKAVAVKNFQKETLGLAEYALLNVPKERRDISTLTVSLNGKDLEEIRELTREYRKSVLKVVEMSRDADAVYQLNVQLFPLTRAGAK